MLLCFSFEKHSNTGSTVGTDCVICSFFFFFFSKSKTNSTNNHKDKNLRQRNTNWAARLLSEYSIIYRKPSSNKYLWHACGQISTPSSVVCEILSEKNKRCVRTSCFLCFHSRFHSTCIDHMKVTMRESRTSRYQDILPLTVWPWRSRVRHALWFLLCENVRWWATQSIMEYNHCCCMQLLTFVFS